MSSCFSVILEDLPEGSLHEIVAGLRHNYCDIEVNLESGRLVLQSCGHSAKFLETAFASEAATVTSVAGNRTLRSSLYDYLLG